MRYISYSRVSTGKQKDNASHYKQQERNRDYGEKQGWELVETVEDTVTGRVYLEREGMQRILKMLSDGTADIVITYSIDRSGRDDRLIEQFIRDVYELDAMLAVSEKYHVYQTAREALKDSFWQRKASQFEADNIKDRTDDGKRRHLERGGFLFYPNYGYKLIKEEVDGIKVKKPAIDAQAADVVKAIFRWFLEGIPRAEITRRLNSMGLENRKQGAGFSDGMLDTLTRNIDKYVGKPFERTYTVDGEAYRVVYAYPAIIDDATYKAVKAAKVKRPRKGKLAPFKGLLYCTCGDTGTHKTTYNRADGTTVYSYICGTLNRAQTNRSQGRAVVKTRCQHRANSVAITQAIKDYLATHTDLATTLAKDIGALAKARAEMTLLQSDKRDRIIELDKERDSLLDKFVAAEGGDALARAINERIQKVDTEMDTLTEEVDTIEGKARQIDLTLYFYLSEDTKETTSQRLQDLVAALDNFDTETINGSLYMLGFRITIAFSAAHPNREIRVSMDNNRVRDLLTEAKGYSGVNLSASYPRSFYHIANVRSRLAKLFAIST